MSYTERYSRTITVTGTVRGSVHYPPSQNGGSVSFSESYSQDVPIDVNIHVDTDPFDNSVNYCNSHVHTLTDAVVATEMAEIIAKKENALKIGSAVITGFFDVIGSDLRMQINKLTQDADTLLLKLRGLAAACVKKQIQMENDYNRISKRYFDIFNDLNRELENRIFELDKPAFTFKRETDKQKGRTSDNDLVSTVAVFGMESGELQSKISASITKKRALDTLNKARMFLLQQKSMNNAIQRRSFSENKEGYFAVPVCYAQTVNDKGDIEQALYASKQLPVMNNHATMNRMASQFVSKSLLWKPMPSESVENIGVFFDSELNKRIPEDTPHTRRVKDMIRQIADIEQIKAANT